MKEIRMVDLKSQYEKIKTDIDAAIGDVIGSTAFIKGPQVKQFEDDLKNYLNVNHVISCGNGTDALQISLMALDLQPGDEVITPDFTFISTVEVVALMGLKPVLADVDPENFNIRPETIRQSITGKTKVILPVHLFGQCANMSEILDIAKEHDLAVIEDVAQATGTDYYHSNGTTQKAGTMGIAGCTSFFPSKNLGCYGDGGAIFTNDDELANKMRIIANHGMKVRYHYDLIGVNSRLDTIQAAILREKLRYLDKYNRARQAAADYYDNAFKDIDRITVPARVSYSAHIFHQYTVKLNDTDRQQMQEFLKSKGIPAMIYYPVPLHRQKAFSYLGYKDGRFPVSEKLCETVLSLPMHTELDSEQLQYITGHIKEYLTK
jgi:UDP-2-acetamido-2-deoxy-ribo-hexuluronate aminotransferase